MKRESAEKDRPPAEFQLLAACCRWPPSPDRIAAVRSAAAGEIDWNRFEQLASRHRVPALAANGLSQAGVPLPSALSAKVQPAVRRSLEMAREELRLQRTFDAAGIHAVFLKGSALAQLAYGEQGIKESWDIDLLVDPAEAIESCRVLAASGYEHIDWVADESQLSRFRHAGKECVLFNRALGITVELHWRLTDNRRLLTGVDHTAPVQCVEFGGGSLRTLGDAPLFAFLCAHGAHHGWFRLKWLADVAAFMSRKDPTEHDRLLREARRLGAGRTAGAALLLCSRILSLPLDDKLRDELDKDRAENALARSSLKIISYAGPAEDVGRLLSPSGLRLFRDQASFIPGWPHLLGLLRAKWMKAPERARLDLPHALGFLYHVLRVPLYLGRQLTKLTR